MRNALIRALVFTTYTRPFVQQQQQNLYSLSTQAMTAEVKATATTAATTATGAVETPPLPKIAPHEFRQYNRMADMMEYYVSSAR